MEWLRVSKDTEKNYDSWCSKLEENLYQIREKKENAFDNAYRYTPFLFLQIMRRFYMYQDNIDQKEGDEKKRQSPPFFMGEVRFRNKMEFKINQDVDMDIQSLMREINVIVAEDAEKEEIALYRAMYFLMNMGVKYMRPVVFKVSLVDDSSAHAIVVMYIPVVGNLMRKILIDTSRAGDYYDTRFETVFDRMEESFTRFNEWNILGGDTCAYEIQQQGSCAYYSLMVAMILLHHWKRLQNRYSGEKGNPQPVSALCSRLQRERNIQIENAVFNSLYVWFAEILILVLEAYKKQTNRRVLEEADFEKIVMFIDTENIVFNERHVRYFQRSMQKYIEYFD